MLEQRRVTVAEGVGLAVRVREPLPSSRPPAVLVHGLASSSRLWDGVASALDDFGHGSVAVDLRGHGQSDAPHSGYDTSTAVADVIAVVEQTTGDRPVLLAGQSWGGNVALQVAARRPDLVAGLALVDGGWIRLASRFADWDSARHALAPPDIDGMPAASFRSMLAPALDGFPDGSLDAAMSTVRVLDDGTIQRRLSVPRHLEILYSLWQDDPRQWYPQVRARTVLMPAVEVGAPLDPEIGAALAAIEQARLRPFPGAHHDVHLQRPVEVAEEIGSLA